MSDTLDTWQRAVILDNVAKDPSYTPYCLRCKELVRMKRIAPLHWRCSCGAQCDLREGSEVHIAPHAHPLMTGHSYLSAGDTPYANGDRAYTGCFLCGRSRREHST